jgi:hypothetical protein
MREMGEQWRKHHEEVLASVSKPGADLRAVVKQMDELKDAGRKQREAGRDRWLAVYDSLDAAQKEKARTDGAVPGSSRSNFPFLRSNLQRPCCS